MVHVPESEAPGQHGKVLDPIGVPIEHVTIHMHGPAHHLLDDLHVGPELLALDKVDLELAPGALVDQVREHRVRAVDDAADCVRAAEYQGLLSSRNWGRNNGDRGQEAGQEPSHVFLPRAASFPCAMDGPCRRTLVGQV